MISLKSAREIEIMRSANVIVAEVLQELKKRVAPGITTLDLDAIAEEMTLSRKAIPAFKGYNVAGRVYPRCLCASINDEIVHGIPSNRRRNDCRGRQGERGGAKVDGRDREIALCRNRAAP